MTTLKQIASEVAGLLIAAGINVNLEIEDAELQDKTLVVNKVARTYYDKRVDGFSVDVVYKDAWGIMDILEESTDIAEALAQIVKEYI